MDMVYRNNLDEQQSVAQIPCNLEPLMYKTDTIGKSMRLISLHLLTIKSFEPIVKVLILSDISALHLASYYFFLII
jgi:hypothetical protein